MSENQPEGAPQGGQGGARGLGDNSTGEEYPISKNAQRRLEQRAIRGNFPLTEAVKAKMVADRMATISNPKAKERHRSAAVRDLATLERLNLTADKDEFEREKVEHMLRMQGDKWEWERAMRALPSEERRQLTSNVMVIYDYPDEESFEQAAMEQQAKSVDAVKESDDAT